MVPTKFLVKVSYTLLNVFTFALIVSVIQSSVRFILILQIEKNRG